MFFFKYQQQHIHQTAYCIHCLSLCFLFGFLVLNLSWSCIQFSRTAVSNYHKLGDLKQKLILYSSRGQSPKSRCWQGCAPPEALGENLLPLAAFGSSRHSLVCSCIAPLCASITHVFLFSSYLCVCVIPCSVLHKDISLDSGSTQIIQMISSEVLNYICKGSFSK